MAEKIDRFIEETGCGFVEASVEEIRAFFDDGERIEDFDTCLDNAQAQVDAGEYTEAFILIRISKHGKNGVNGVT
jgi:hypothetical protein